MSGRATGLPVIVVALLVGLFVLSACEPWLSRREPTKTPEPTASPTAAKPSETGIPTASPPRDTPTPGTGPKCIGAAAGGGHPPTRTQDLTIQINLPGLKRHEPVLEYFNQIARECDGVGLRGRGVEDQPWQEIIGEIPTGIVFYSLTSLEQAQATADQWADAVDWFAYELVLADRTPAQESADPAQASKMARDFAREQGLVYFATPGRPVTVRHAADVAQYADAYGLQAYGEQRESPETYIQLVKDTSDQIRAVNPDILLFVAFGTIEPEDDPQTAYNMITQLLGYIDGVFIRTSGQLESLEKLKTLVTLLRAE